MRLVRTFTVLLLVLGACNGRPQRLRGSDDNGDEPNPLLPHVAEFDLRAGAGETGSGSLLAGAASNGFADLVAKLDEVSSNTAVKGIFVRFGGATLGMARAEELGRLLGPLRKKFPIICHADGYGNASLLAAATGCTEVWLTPAGSVEAVGLAAQLVFARALFDKLGVKVDFMQEGRFKGAEEPFTRDEPSPEARSSLEAALQGIRQTWLKAIEGGRGLSAEALGLEDGPYSAGDALDKKLIDKLGFETEARARSLELAGAQGRVVAFGGEADQGSGVGEIVRALAGTPQVGLPHVAVVRATGAISTSGGAGFGTSGGISERALTPVLRRLARDPLTRAVVIRIDSPGGSALASDLLWREVMNLRRAKPVVVSVGGMAASGGYYIASAANKIVAERSSIVGSIGVVMGKLAFGDSLGQLGVHVTVIPAREGGGTRAAYDSPLVSWDPATRAKLERAMKATYQLFLSRIAEGRSMQVTALAPAAEGRIMAGAEAQERGLIDALGGLTEAIVLARELAHEDPQMAAYLERETGGLFDFLRGGDRGEASLRRLEGAATAKAMAALLAPLGAAGPLREDILALAGMLAPLSLNEHVLAVTPFVVSIR